MSQARGLNTEVYTKMSDFFKTFAAVALLAVVAGCKPDVAALPDDVLARVDGADITVRLMKLDNDGEIPKGYPARKDLLDRMILNRIVSTEAAGKGYLTDQDVQGEVAEFEGGEMAEKVYQKYLADVEITEKDLPAPEEFGDTALELSEMDFADLATAEKALAELKAGAKFEDVVKKRGTGISAATGGHIGWQNLRNAMYPAGVKAALKKLGKGETSPILKTDFGYSVFVVHDRKEAEQVREEGKKSLLDRVRTQKAKDKMYETLKRLRKEYNVRYNPELEKGNLHIDWAAKVGETTISISDAISGKKPESHKPHGGTNPAMVITSLNRMIDNLLLAREGKRLGLDNDLDYVDRRKLKVEEFMTKVYLRKALGVPDEPSDEDIKAYYDQNKERFKRKETVHLGRILVKTEKEAEVVLKDLKAGKDFNETAFLRSKDKSAKLGGDMGVMPVDQLSEPFKSEEAKLKPGELSGVVKSKYGYEIIKLHDRKPAGIPPVEELRPILAKRAVVKLKGDKVLSYVSNLYKTHKVQVNEKLLNKL